MANRSRLAQAPSGYTLIELLLYISIVGVLLTTATIFFGTVADARIKNQTISEVNQQGVAVLELIAQTVRNANTITAPSAGTTANSLTVTVPNASLSPTIINLNGTTLQIKEGAASAVPLTNSKVQVSTLQFKNLSRSGTPGVVQISFVVSRLNPANRNEYAYQKTFTATAALRK